MGALAEEDLAIELLTRLIAHDVLPVPSKSPGLRGTGARSVTGASRRLRQLPAADAEVAPPCGVRLICWARVTCDSHERRHGRADRQLWRVYQ